MYKYKPSKKRIKEFISKMDEIAKFCEENTISTSSTNDSYYFSINGINYRVSNHTINQSNRKAFNQFGVQVREKYHNDEKDDNTVYITASKTRIIEIYNNLKNGKLLDRRGHVINKI